MNNSEDEFEDVEEDLPKPLGISVGEEIEQNDGLV